MKKEDMKMKMRKVMAAAGLTAVMILAGCGGNTGGDAGQTQEAEETVQENTDQTDTEESGQEESEQAEKTENDQTEQSGESAGGAETSESADGAETYEDNFAVDSEAVTAFADRIKEAVAAKDLEALADRAGKEHVGCVVDVGSRIRYRRLYSSQKFAHSAGAIHHGSSAFRDSCCAPR